jgi:hypothetical protein
MNDLQEKIKNTLINAPSGVHSVYYAPKTKNGIETDEYSIVYLVEQKLPLSAISQDQLIPKNLSFDNNTFKTDVIEVPTFKTVQCNPLNASNVRFLQTYNRPLSGGLEIANLGKLQFFNTIDLGTLGLIAVDNTDNTLVGLTNLHVAILDGFNTAERNPNGQIFNTYSPFNFNQYTITSTTAQYGSFDSKGTFIFNDVIGRPKRYVPLTTDINGDNLDAALVALNVGTTDASSACQALLANTYAIPFATTAEIDNILSSPIGTYPIYSVGRTTGPKGANCPMEIFAYGASNVPFNRQGTQSAPNEVVVRFYNMMYYRFKDQSNLPIYGGDSGSAVVVNYNGQNKIIGLAFAGDTSNPNNVPTSTRGLMARIDVIAQKLNISAWDGSPKNFTSNTQQSISYIVRPPNDTRTSISYNGKTYYQAGLIRTSDSDANV